MLTEAFISNLITQNVYWELLTTSGLQCMFYRVGIDFWFNPPGIPHTHGIVVGSYCRPRQQSTHTHTACWVTPVHTSAFHARLKPTPILNHILHVCEITHSQLVSTGNTGTLYTSMLSHAYMYRLQYILDLLHFVERHIAFTFNQHKISTNKQNTDLKHRSDMYLQLFVIGRITLNC